MDEFERRLTDELQAAGRAVEATSSVDVLVRRKVRHRKTVAGVAGLVPMLLVVVGAAWAFRGAESASSKFREVDAAIDGPTSAPAPTTVAPPTTEPPGAAAMAVLGPGEVVEIDWPDAAILGEQDRVPLFLVAESAGDERPVWGAAGTAIRNDDGTATLQIATPTRAARLESVEFGVADFAALSPGRYTLAVDRWGQLRDAGRPVVVELTLDDASVADISAEAPVVDPGVAILRSSGVGAVDFGLGRADAVAAFEAEFGVAVVYRPADGCLTTGYAFVGDFLVAEFWGDEGGPDSGFSAWHYGGDNRFDSEAENSAPTNSAPTNSALTDIGLTTESGIGIGTTLAEVRATGGGASGRYDAAWGATIWFENDTVGGELTADMTEANPRVASISGGRAGNPARTVC